VEKTVPIRLEVSVLKSSKRSEVRLG
jgi:hypothetical protein